MLTEFSWSETISRNSSSLLATFSLTNFAPRGQQIPRQVLYFYNNIMHRENLNVFSYACIIAFERKLFARGEIIVIDYYIYNSLAKFSIVPMHDSYKRLVKIPHRCYDAIFRFAIIVKIWIVVTSTISRVLHGVKIVEIVRVYLSSLLSRLRINVFDLKTLRVRM